ncbi:PAP2 superfamily protein [Ruminiclostridium hungatei]|uniref:PAP2 superfamily protein n=1 Tax=Ruminiclostridium hungatei TaxID=48256 RepID=A0A1V4SLL5_RUMHU|nr:phosphatase PAP2 family protein [Ruminiclostridium hungatei]OPX44772.1 PAP2 superfamily protein [Ruminiclostridium hungatei]
MNTDLLMQNGKKGYLYRILFMLLVPMAQGIYFFLNLTTTQAYDITIFLDKFIPFNEWFIIPYVFWYVYTFGALLVLALTDYKTYYRLLFSIVTGMLVCFVIYYIFPTTVPRPHVPGTNPLQKMVLSIYGNDKPYNCFPSIHMLDTLLITLFVFKHNKHLWIKAASAVICVSIYLSTWFVKQHSILDAVASTILAVILFFVFENQHVIKKLVSLRELLFFQKRVKELSE